MKLTGRGMSSSTARISTVIGIPINAGTPSLQLLAVHRQPTNQPDCVLIGRRRYPFASFAEASRAYTAAIAETGATVSGRTGPAAPDCVFMKRYFDEDYCVGHVSYNGNVWSYEPHDLAHPERHILVWSPSSAGIR